ncbi:metalloregulator ArsR/SmtB family transcription factor [Halobacteriaceae bacterium SHR40]|uniref:ArsR/SmtB family transcription factor n=1 Tax=Halovenus amylolytica TaxID=2500550 RepID=UPI000FE32280
MESAEFLDLLGNANRRRILRLLAERPCYVTEISEFLGVSPKAVIDHLRKLEEAGLIESRTDEKRRKYFSIARHIRLEVTVSPYEFGTKSAYPASSRLDITSCRQLRIDLDKDIDETDQDRDPDDIVSLAEALHSVETLENELSLAQRWAQGRITELRRLLENAVGGENSRLLTNILLELAEGPTEVEVLSRKLEVPPRVIDDILDDLVEDGVVTRDGHEYRLET